MEKLYEHTLKRQMEEKLAAQDAKLDRLMELVSMQQSQLATRPAGAAALPEPDDGAACQFRTVNSGTMRAHTINNGVMQQITINVFGQENTKHIGRQTIKDLLDNVLKGTQDPAQGAIAALLKAAMLIYSDADHPENLTCYLPNNKKDDVLVHGAAGWEVQPYTVVLPPMATRSVDTLFDNQPFVDADKYGDLMKALAENERAYKEGKEMRTILVRNKDLLKQVLGSLPK